MNVSAGLVRHRFGSFDLGLALQALGRQPIGPCEDYCQWEAQAENQQYRLKYPARGRNIPEHDVGNLQDEPRGNDVGSRDANDIASFKFLI